jgi:hypothetical protein
MSPAPSTAQISPPSYGVANPSSRKRDDLAYQAVTVAAILLVLCTVWVF